MRVGITIGRILSWHGKNIRNLNVDLDQGARFDCDRVFIMKDLASVEEAIAKGAEKSSEGEF